MLNHRWSNDEPGTFFGRLRDYQFLGWWLEFKQRGLSTYYGFLLGRLVNLAKLVVSEQQFGGITNIIGYVVFEFEVESCDVLNF